MIDSGYGVIHTADIKMRQILAKAENVASSRASILISGESGTGKELIARFIHAKSHRALKRFVAINCAAVPEGLLESELFGYEKGAFTGADARKLGKFEQAHESTFLLDEISEMSLLLQAKLLRVLQESEVERLGGKNPIPINVRLIATTNRDLRKMVTAGQFREDLFYRLNVIPFEVPPLRIRPKDIELLTQHFIELACNENSIPRKTIENEAMRKLIGWSWPGNVRELENTIERTVLLCAREKIQASDIELPDSIPSTEKIDYGYVAGMTISEVEKSLILKTLEHTGQNRTQAARLLGISIRTLRNKLNEYRLVGGQDL
jgi:two-component system response regulator FlrC